MRPGLAFATGRDEQFRQREPAFPATVFHLRFHRPTRWFEQVELPEPRELHAPERRLRTNLRRVFLEEPGALGGMPGFQHRDEEISPGPAIGHSLGTKTKQPRRPHRTLFAPGNRRRLLDHEEIVRMLCEQFFKPLSGRGVVLSDGVDLREVDPESPIAAALPFLEFFGEREQGAFREAGFSERWSEGESQVRIARHLEARLDRRAGLSGAPRRAMPCGQRGHGPRLFRERCGEGDRLFQCRAGIRRSPPRFEFSEREPGREPRRSHFRGVAQMIPRFLDRASPLREQPGQHAPIPRVIAVRSGFPASFQGIELPHAAGKIPEALEGRAHLRLARRELLVGERFCGPFFSGGHAQARAGEAGKDQRGQLHPETGAGCALFHFFDGARCAGASVRLSGQRFAATSATNSASAAAISHGQSSRSSGAVRRSSRRMSSDCGLKRPPVFSAIARSFASSGGRIRNSSG